MYKSSPDPTCLRWTLLLASELPQVRQASEKPLKCNPCPCCSRQCCCTIHVGSLCRDPQRAAVHSSNFMAETHLRLDCSCAGLITWLNVLIRASLHFREFKQPCHRQAGWLGAVLIAQADTHLQKVQHCVECPRLRSSKKAHINMRACRCSLC